MSTLRFLNGSYNKASGTRDAFGALSDALVAEGHPEMRVTSGDRETADQIAIFVDRYDQRATGTGPYGDVRYWDGSRDGYPGGTRWVRVKAGGTVAAPRTSNHEARRSNDLAMPYNSDTAAHARARQLAPRFGIECDGINFSEWWHWTFRGPLGTIGELAGGAATPFNPVTFLEGFTMGNPIINVVPKNGAKRDDGTLFIGRDDGTFEQYTPPYAPNIRGILSVVFFGGTDGGKDIIPTLSAQDFEAVKRIWKTMCAGRTDADAVWNHQIPALDVDGRPEKREDGSAVKFAAWGYAASTNAQVNALRNPEADGEPT